MLSVLPNCSRMHMSDSFRPWADRAALTFAAVVYDSHQLIVHELAVFQIHLLVLSFHHAQIYLVLLQGVFYAGRVVVQHGNGYVREFLGKFRQQRWQHVLGYGCAGSHAQFALSGVAEHAHFVIHAVVCFQNVLAVFQQQFAGGCQRYFVAEPFEQGRLEGAFKLLDVFGNGRLADENLFCGFGEAQVSGYADKYFQAKIGHGVVYGRFMRLFLRVSQCPFRPLFAA